MKNTVVFFFKTIVLKLVRPTGTTSTRFVEVVNCFSPHIDFNHWKVAFIGNPILNYATKDLLKPDMHKDATSRSIVFLGVTTANTTYSKTELREQMTPKNNNDTWIFAKKHLQKQSMRT